MVQQRNENFQIYRIQSSSYTNTLVEFRESLKFKQKIQTNNTCMHVTGRWHKQRMQINMKLTEHSRRVFQDSDCP